MYCETAANFIIIALNLNLALNSAEAVSFFLKRRKKMVATTIYTSDSRPRIYTSDS